MPDLIDEHRARLRHSQSRHLGQRESGRVYARRLLKLAQRQRLEEHLDICSAFQAICHKTEDYREALTAFFEKRAGVFRGR